MPRNAIRTDTTMSAGPATAFTRRRAVDGGGGSPARDGWRCARVAVSIGSGYRGRFVPVDAGGLLDSAPVRPPGSL